MRFSAGMLSNALGVLVACHVERCPHCQEKTRIYEQFGGELIAESDDAELPADLLDKTLARLSDEGESAPVKVSGNVPRPLQRFLPDDVSQIPWKGMSKAIKEFRLPFGDDEFDARLYKIAAGKQLPEHTHRGREFTLVLSGSFSDNAGAYHAGDFVLADTSVMHRPRAHAEQDCICFAVLDAPLKFTGWFGALVNPFMR